MAKRTPIPSAMQKRWDARQGRIIETEGESKEQKNIHRLYSLLEEQKDKNSSLANQLNHAINQKSSFQNQAYHLLQDNNNLEEDNNRLKLENEHLSSENRRLQAENVEALDAESRASAAEAEVQSLKLSVQLLKKQNEEEREARETFIHYAVHQAGFYHEVYNENFEKPTLEELSLQMSAFRRMIETYLLDIKEDRTPAYKVIQAVLIKPDTDFYIIKRFYHQDAVYAYARSMGYQVDSLRTITIDK